jgi:hypothetical protein
MAYVKTTWVNTTSPAINAGNLNKLEQGVEDAHDGFGAAQTTANAAQSTANTANATANAASGVANSALATANAADAIAVAAQNEVINARAGQPDLDTRLDLADAARAATQAQLDAQKIVADNHALAALISAYPEGASQMRVTTAAGYPVNGTLTANREANAGRQILQGTDNSVWARYSQTVLGLPAWTGPFERMAKTSELDGGSTITSTRLATWAKLEAWRFTPNPVVVDSAGRPLTQAIEWTQDLSAGVYTPSNFDANAKEFNTFTLTHTASGKTAATTYLRNSKGYVINDPVWTVS